MAGDLRSLPPRYASWPNAARPPPLRSAGLTAMACETAEGAGTLLVKLVPDIQKTAELVREIAAASAEQNTGASQVNKAIQQLDQVIQQNAAASEEMASTAEGLASQADVLQSAIGFFKVDEHPRTSRGSCSRRPGRTGRTRLRTGAGKAVARNVLDWLQRCTMPCGRQAQSLTSEPITADRTRRDRESFRSIGE